MLCNDYARMEKCEDILVGNGNNFYNLINQEDSDCTEFFVNKLKAGRFIESKKNFAVEFFIFKQF